MDVWFIAELFRKKMTQSVVKLAKVEPCFCECVDFC